MATAAPRIERVEIWRYALRYAHGTYVMSRGREIDVLDSTVVVLRSGEGLAGYGEVCPLGPTYLPAFAGGALAALRELAPAVCGLPATSVGALHEAMDAALAGHAYAKSAVDVAAHDLLGKIAGLPACELLGGRRSDAVPLYVAVPLGSAQDMVSFVLDQRAQGIHRFQLKIGADPADDAARVEAVLEATGEEDIVVADANGGWRLAEAVHAAGLLDGLPRLRLEQPCATLDECLQVRRRCSLPLVLDEVILDARTLIAAVAERAVEGVNCKISRLGGLAPARRLRDLCTDLGLALTIEDTWGGDLTTAAVAALSGSCDPRALYAASFMNDWTLEHVAGYEPRSAAGFGPVPEGPGLGVAVEDSALGELVVAVDSAGS